MSLIYITTNLINNHKYIGKQVDDNKTNYFGSGIYLTNAIKLYGKENFQKEIIIRGNFNNRYARGKDWSKVTRDQIPITSGRILKKDWLQGYKELSKKQWGGKIKKSYC